MAEEPTLPRLPSSTEDESSQASSSSATTTGSRKRVRPQESRDAPPLTYNSSDPAIFSSDDDPALDNYVEGRRKKRYVGSWFQQHPASSDSAFGDAIHVPKQRRAWARQADSGVFLGSDGNESDDMMDHLEIPTKPKLPQLQRRPIRPVSKDEQAARDKIRRCIEQGDEAIDLWSMSLETISNDTISPLAQFSCIPLVTKDVAFEQRDPQLKIYLAMNRLTRVPGALFDLTNLTILSLRGNKLTELPPSINKLTNLQELNVSQNRLRHVPIELVDLFTSNKLHTLVLHPNPFFQPSSEFESQEDVVSFQNLPPISVDLPCFISRSLGRSPVQYGITCGRILSNFRLPTDPTIQTLAVEEVADKKVDTISMSNFRLPADPRIQALALLALQEETISPTPAAEVPSELGRPTKVPSLIEVALRACYGSTQLPEMIHYMPDELVHLKQLLDRASRQKQAGGVKCSTCEKLHVVSAAEWVEWREIRTSHWVSRQEGLYKLLPLSTAEGEMAVPFLHRGCSWKCGPVKAAGAYMVNSGRRAVSQSTIASENRRE